MKMPARLLACCAAILPVIAAAQDADPAEQAGELLVVPPAEARDTGGENPDQAAPSEPPAVPEQAPAAPTEEATGNEAAADAGDTLVPPAFPVSRYQQLWERSPFQLESIAPPTESVGIAQKFALTGIAQINGDPIVFLLERATQTRHMLDKKTNTAGLSLVQVDMQQKLSESTATVRQGSEQGVVKFDPGANAAPGMMPPAIPQPGRPIIRATQPGMPQAAAIPPQVVPAATPVMPSQPIQQQQPAQGITQTPGLVPSVPGPQPGQDSAQAGTPVPGQESQPPPRVIRRRAIIQPAP